DPSVFAFEKERIFNHSWHFVGHSSQVQKAGDFFSCKAGDVPAVVVRDENNQLRAYVNVCKHRGAEVIADGTCGNRKSLTCSYHGWTYGLDGELKAAPHSNHEACFEKSKF